MVSQTHLIRVRTAVVGRQLQNQAEKSHPILFDGNIKIGSATEPNVIAIFHAVRRSVGELSAINHSTGEYSAQCQ